MSAGERSMNELDDAERRPWERVRRRLRAEFGEALYESWFRRLDLEQMADSVAMVAAPTKFVTMWIESHYLSRLHAAFCAEFGGDYQICLRTREASAREKPMEAPAVQNAATAADRAGAS